ncbi:MAG: lanthionine synthetase LanC family protein [Chthoniobacterales bacterium]
MTATGQNSDRMNGATASASWLLSQEVREPGDGGSYWPSRSDLSLEEKCDLYYGNAGILLFLRELYEATGRPEYREAIRRGVRFLERNISRVGRYGLYDGLAGIAFSLAQWPDDPEAVAGCSRAVDRLLREKQDHVNAGVRWNQHIDVMSGSAGIGLSLLELGRKLHRPELTNLAVRAEVDLTAVSSNLPRRRYWVQQSNEQKQYPNFSHGTAGVGYFLLKLYEETGHCRFLDAANDAANCLQSIMSTDPGTECLIPHDLPEGRELFYLGWCHGPAGTNRFFYELFSITKEVKWQSVGQTAAETILRSGIPEQQTPGHWNNVSRCCGVVSVGEFFLGLYRKTKKVSYRQFAFRLGKHLENTAQADGQGLKWIQAENRIEPDRLIAQTGLMQGGAGIGLFLLHLADPDNKHGRGLLFPDSPW